MRDFAAERVKRWRRDPVAMVVEEFRVEPNAWQREALYHYATHNRLALKQGAGDDRVPRLVRPELPGDAR